MKRAYWEMTDVKPLTNYTVLITFVNNVVKVFDMKPLLDKKVYISLNDIEIFNKVNLAHGTLTWQGGIDIAPEYVYEHGIVVNREYV